MTTTISGLTRRSDGGWAVTFTGDPFVYRTRPDSEVTNRICAGAINAGDQVIRLGSVLSCSGPGGVVLDQIEVQPTGPVHTDNDGRVCLGRHCSGHPGVE